MDKAGFCGNLWGVAAKESIVFVLDPTGAHDVPAGHVGADAEGIKIKWLRLAIRNPGGDQREWL